jgi:hypothetical protein
VGRGVITSRSNVVVAVVVRTRSEKSFVKRNVFLCKVGWEA